MAYDIGGMLARSGATTGQLMAGGIADVGAGIGGLLTRRREKQAEQNAQQQFQQILGAYQNNPAGMRTEAQSMVASGDPNLQRVGQMLLQEATRLEGVRTAQTAALETSGQDIQREAQRKRAMQVALQDGNENALVALKAGALDPVEYLKGRVTAGGVETFQGTPGTQFLRRDPETGKLTVEATVPFKTEAAPAGKGIKTVEREDGSVSVLNADDGSLISTLPPPDTSNASQEASLNLIAQTTSFIQDIDALMDPGFTETGFIGGVTAAVPGTPAYDREKELLSIRARLGFDQINEMKRLAAESGASGTGLGQISNIEFMSLQSTIDAIYTGMSGDAQNKALEAIKKHLLNVQQLASGVAPADAIDWSAPEYKAVGYHKDPETGTVFYAPNGKSGTVYKLVNGKFVKVGA